MSPTCLSVVQLRGAKGKTLVARYGQGRFVSRSSMYDMNTRWMSSSSSSQHSSQDEGGAELDEKAKRSALLRKTLASLKPLTQAQAARKTEESAVTDSESSAEADVDTKKASSTKDEVVAPVYWTTRPEPKSEKVSTPQLTWGQWLRSPEAMKASVKHEWEHYRDGSKLLYYNVVATKQIFGRRLRGESLTRREYALLVRTASDLFRLVPFAVIVVIPFMEFALPVLLKLFPNMLPSTFANKLQQKEQLKKQLNLKIEMARFLQDTLIEMKGDPSDTETQSFIGKLKSGEGVTTDELVQFAKVFNEDVTLNGLQRNQLTAMCRMLGLQPFGTDALLIVQIRMKIASLKRDDKVIVAEGVDTLTLDELQHAVLARGMYSQTRNHRVLRERLRSWLDMSVTKNVPITLLILSRAFALNARADLAQTLKDTFDHMPQELIDEIEVRVGGKFLGRKVDRKLKLEALEQFRSLIEEERASIGSSKAASANGQSSSGASHFAALATLTQPTELERLQIEELRSQVANIKADIIDDVKDLQKSLDALQEKLQKEQDAEYEELLRKRERGFEEAFVTNTAADYQSVNELETDEDFNARWKEKRNDILSQHLSRQREREAETKSAKNLEKRVDDLIARLGVDVAEAKTQLEDDLKVLDKNYDGLISEDELKHALNTLNEKLTDEQVQQVLDKLDANHDGLIEVDHLFKVARELDIDLSTAVQEARDREAAISEKTAKLIDEQDSSSASSSSTSNKSN